MLFLLQCLGDYKRDVGQSKMCSEDTRWCFGGGALGTDGKQEAGSLRMNLDDSQPRNENHPHPREVVQIPGGVPHCYGLNLQFSPKTPDLSAQSLARGAVLKAVEP